MARLVLGLVVCLAVAVFAAENSQPTTIRFLGLQSPPVYLAVVVLGSALLGALAVLLLGGLEVLHLRRRIAQLENGPEPSRPPALPVSAGSPAPPAPPVAPTSPVPAGSPARPAPPVPAASHTPPTPPAEGDGAGGAPAGPGR